MQRSPITTLSALSLAMLAALPALAQTTAAADTQNNTVQITATRFGEPVQQVPGSISVVTGAEIRARGATDLRSALALLGGVSVAPGGDAGPAGAAPSLLGVREVDDLLLLIDGIPAGGTFVPQVEAVSLLNVERIEVLRGAAPVYFGTTAFAGTINIIHYAAGQADSGIGLRYGSHGSLGASGAAVISSGAVRQSISGELSEDKYSDPRTRARRAQGSWRGATDLGGGTLSADLHLLWLHQKPGSPSLFDDTTGQLSALLPKDFNQNPSNAKLDSDRAQLVLRHELPLAWGRWGSTLAYTETQTDSVRGFIDTADTPPPWTASTVADLEAFQQTRKLRDLFIDSHLTSQPLPGLDLTAGVNLLLGRAHANSLRHAHKLQLDGVSQLGDINSVAAKSTVAFNDKRRFLGVYAQGRYALGADASLLAGLRWNRTHEDRSLTRVNARGVTTESSQRAQDINRLSGTLGGQWGLWQAAPGPVNAMTLHASVGNTFQPAQIDFGPNPETNPPPGTLPKAETQRSLVMGLKADAWGGLAEFDIDAFVVDFNNQPVQTTTTAGTFVVGAGQQRFKGVDIEGALRPAAGWTVKANLTWADARYRDFVDIVDGNATQLAGRHQVLTPTWRGAAGLIFAPQHGPQGSLTASWTGKHWLNRLNTAQAPAYTVVDASIGYRFEAFSLQLTGANLGDRRDAVQASELGEDQFYRLPGRRVVASVWMLF